MRRSSRLVLGVTTLAILAGTPAAFAQSNANLQQLVQRYYQEQQKQQQDLAKAVQQRNQAYVKQYQAAIKQRQEAYRKQMEEFQKQGITPQQLVQMQREAVLAQVPRSQQSALKRKWAREDRIRERALDRARRTGDAPEKADTGLDLGGLGDLDVKADDGAAEKPEEKPEEE